MTSLDAIRELVRHCQPMVEMVMQDVSVEHANWLPPGTANSIGLTYLHLVNYHDFYINEVAQGKLTRWAADGWDQRLGYSDARKMSREAAQERRIDPDAVKVYADGVFADAAAFLNTLTDEDLDREVPGYRGPVSMGIMLTRSAAYHVFLHMGEITALKGVQGLKGLPF